MGGPARHVVWLTEALQDAEFESVLIAGTVPKGEEDMAYFADARGVKPIFIEQMSRELSVKDVWALVRIWRELVNFKPDIVHTHTAKAGTLGRVAAFFYKWITPGTLIGRPRAVKVFHTFHGHIFHGYYGSAKTSLFLFIEKILARVATNRIVAISNLQAAEIGEKYNVASPETIEVIPLGLELEGFSAGEKQGQGFRSELAVGESENLVGIVGRLTEIKNHVLFVEAVKAFRGNSDYCGSRFVVIGDGHLRDELESDAEGSGIIFAGNRDDAQEFYSALDLVVLTSKNEGTPLTLIEAMASGVPWVATRVGGVPDLAGNEIKNSRFETDSSNVTICERGLLVEPGNADAIAKGINILLSDDALKNTISVNGRAFVNDNYSKGRLVRDIKKLYGIAGSD